MTLLENLDEIKALADAATYSDAQAFIARIRRTLRGGLPDLLTSEKANLIQVIEHWRSLRAIVPAQNEALRVAVEALSEFADYDNPNQPKAVCWPASEYMKKSRGALARIETLLGVKSGLSTFIEAVKTTLLKNSKNT